MERLRRKLVPAAFLLAAMLFAAWRPVLRVQMTRGRSHCGSGLCRHGSATETAEREDTGALRSATLTADHPRYWLPSSLTYQLVLKARSRIAWLPSIFQPLKLLHAASDGSLAPH